MVNVTWSSIIIYIREGHIADYYILAMVKT